MTNLPYSKSKAVPSPKLTSKALFSASFTCVGGEACTLALALVGHFFAVFFVGTYTIF